MSKSTDSLAAPTLAKVQRDLTDATDALAAYWGRNSQTDLDYAVGDVHRAVEALTRAVASLAYTVERLAEVN
jgi:uncharacterized protein YukE